MRREENAASGLARTVHGCHDVVMKVFFRRLSVWISLLFWLCLPFRLDRSSMIDS